MSMYKFVKGSRLFMQGTRESSDYDNVADTFHPSTFAESPSSSRLHGSNNVVHHRVQVHEGHSSDGGASRSYSPSPRGGGRFTDVSVPDFDEPGDIRAVHTLRSMAVDGNTEWERSAKTVRHGGIKTRSTRTVRKVTTVTRGEQSVTSESIMKYGSDNSQIYPAVSHDKRSLKFRVVDKVRRSPNYDFGHKLGPLFAHACDVTRLYSLHPFFCSSCDVIC